MNFAQLNKLSHSLWGEGALITDIRIPITKYEIWARQRSLRISEFVQYRTQMGKGRKVEVK